MLYNILDKMCKSKGSVEIKMPILDFNNKKDVEEYESFVLNRKGSSFMQDLNWGKVKNNWKHEAIYLKENGNIIATMMILIQKLPHTNVSLMYAPRGPVCDVYDIDLVNKLIKEADPLVKKYNAFALKFDPQILYDKKLDEMYKKSGYKTSGYKPNGDNLIQPSHNMVLNIENKTEEELMKGFAEKTRYNVRLSKRKGVTVRYSRSIEDLKTFYDIYKVTTIRDKIGCRDYDYFERMLDAYDESKLRIYIAEHEGDKLSAAIATNVGGELFYVYGASSNEKRNLMPNYAMQMEMIRWGIETGCSTYNFGGVLNLSPDNGLYKFKVGFCKEKGLEEYIGEINKVYKPFMFFLYNKVLPIVRVGGRKLRRLKTH